MKEIKFINPDKEAIISSLEAMLQDAKDGKITSLLYVTRHPDRTFDWGMQGIQDRFEVGGMMAMLSQKVLNEELVK